MTLETEQRFEDRLLRELIKVQADQRRPASTQRTVRRHSRRRLLVACAVPLVAVSCGAVVVVSLLGASRPSIAKAAVLRHAAAALEPNGEVLYVEGTVYGTGEVLLCLGGEVPSRCISPATHDASLSPEPSEDPVGYTYREWVGSSMNEQHVIYETGDETVRRGATTEVYDPSNNTITTSETAIGPASSAELTTGIPDVKDLTLANLKALYARAESNSPGTRLVGETTIDGEAAYQLEITSHEQLGSDTIESTLVLDLNAHSFLPIRAVESGTTPASSTNTTRGLVTFSARMLPDTASNEALLRLPKHAGAATVALSQAEKSEVRPMFVSP